MSRRFFGVTVAATKFIRSFHFSNEHIFGVHCTNSLSLSLSPTLKSLNEPFIILVNGVKSNSSVNSRIKQEEVEAGERKIQQMAHTHSVGHTHARNTRTSTFSGFSLQLLAERTENI